jgi:dienelactone hydrolase
MEKEIRIKIDGRHAVYGRFSGSNRKPLFISVHGLPGDYREQLHENAAQWFVKHGFATFRFSLYGYEKDARQLIDCTLRTHADDLDAIVCHFRKQGFKKIFVSGHSYGGAATLLSKDQGFDAAALWDPSYKITFTKPCYGMAKGKYVSAVKGYVMRWGTNVIIGKAMAEEADKLRWNDLTKNFRVPLKIITAGNGVLVPGNRHYFKTANAPKAWTVIKGATHYFDDRPGMQERLFEASKRWFERVI